MIRASFIQGSEQISEVHTATASMEVVLPGKLHQSSLEARRFPIQGDTIHGP